MIGIVAKLSIKDGKQADFEAVAIDLMAKVKANEPGCTMYQLFKEQGSETEYVFMETYTDMDAVKTHGGTDYFKAAGAKFAECLAGRPEVSRYTIVE